MPCNKRPLTAALKDSLSRNNYKTLMFLNIPIILFESFKESTGSL